MKKYRKYLLAIALPLSLALSIAASSSFFEISKNIDLFVSVYKKVDELYVDEVDHSRIMRKGIDAMLSELDPYTVFYSESQVEDFRFQQTGKYGGIGARIGKLDKKLTVLEIYQGYPAYKAGLKVGDVVLKVDGKSFVDNQDDELSEYLKGEPGSMVTIMIERPISGEKEELEIQREEVKVDNVSYAGMLDDETGYVRFENFRQNAGDEVRTNLEELKAQGMKRFVLDMRGNPGGLLHEAVNIVNLFIGPKNLVVSTKGRNPDHQREYETYRKAYDEDIPVAVLIDGGSASASEIVSGSIQDYDRGVIIGRTSFGKGLVQTTRPLSYNAQIKVTISKYYTASGRCIQRLDYASRDEEGEVKEVPDSLISEFKTMNGRTVTDGAGIEPDVVVEKGNTPDILRELTKKHLVFDFVTRFCHQYDTIPLAFQVNDSIYNDFIDFTRQKDFTFDSRLRKKYDELSAMAGKLELDSEFEKELKDVEQLLIEKKERAFSDHKEAISEAVRLEIVERFHFRKGRAKAALEGDPDVIKALEILSQPNKYKEILSPA